MELYEVVCRLAHRLGSAFTGMDRNGPNYHIGPDCEGTAAIAGSFRVRIQTGTNCELIVICFYFGVRESLMLLA